MYEILERRINSSKKIKKSSTELFFIYKIVGGEASNANFGLKVEEIPKVF